MGDITAKASTNNTSDINNNNNNNKNNNTKISATATIITDAAQQCHMEYKSDNSEALYCFFPSSQPKLTPQEYADKYKKDNAYIVFENPLVYCISGCIFEFMISDISILIGCI